MASHRWQRVSKSAPCPICKHADWCSLSADGALAKCMRVEEGCWRSKTDRDGVPYHLHRLAGADRPAPPPPPRPPGPEAPRAAPDLLHRAYSALLARLALSKAHREALRQRGLSDDEMDRRSYRTLPVRGRAAVARDVFAHIAGEAGQPGDNLLSVPGFVTKQGEGGRPYLTIAGAAGLLVPVRDLAGRIVALLSRRDDAKGAEGKYSYLSSVKHGGPGPGAPVHVPFGVAGPCPTCRLTEGALKADIAFALSGLPTIGAAGLAWRPALDVLHELGCQTVRLALDADALDKPTVARALSACAEAAGAAGLAVELERWELSDGKGIDDLLAAGKAPAVLTGEAARVAIGEAVAAATAGELPQEPSPLDRLPDVLAAGGAAALFNDKPLLEALARLKTANPAGFAARRAVLKGLVSLRDLDAALKPFLREQAQERPPVLLNEAGYCIDNGRIVREVSTHDGGLATIPLCNFTARITEVVVRDDGAEQTAFFALAGALADGRELPAVQVPAADFAGLGWVTTAWHGEAVVYAGQGTRDHLRAALELLSEDRARRTVYAHTGWREIAGSWHYLQASLALLDGLAPDRLVFPLVGAVYRAALGEAPGAIDLSLFLAGPHSAGKSELAALAQQHYGAGLDARHLPAGWSSTANALEGLAFAAKDALLVVDDWAPAGAVGDRQRLERDADRLLRAQGNRAGRQRMRADGSLRPSRPPRGLILSTGEDTPPGQSLRGRMLVLEVSPDDVLLTGLTPHQHAAAAGQYAAALAGFVRWLAPQYGELCGRLPGERTALRDRAQTGSGSARTPGIVADVTLGLKLFFDFACAAGALTDAERGALARRGWEALREAAAAQAEHVQAAEPTALFLRLLAAALASGRAHVAGPDGAEPGALDRPEAWGWRLRTMGTGEHARDEWQPQGERVGWVDGADLYLEPQASHASAQELARDQGGGLPVSPRTLWKRLKERGLLASWEDARQRNTVRRTLAGVRDREVLHLRADTLSPSLQPSAPSAGSGESAETADGCADGCADGNGRGAHNRPREPSANAAENPVCGRFGRSATGGGGASGRRNAHEGEADDSRCPF
ncbi:MAG: DUF927 domain-containing protein [Planctomycetes bacterium]|nr:DUF927 domain-containing protein [Planctomycetota bacterium]